MEYHKDDVMLLEYHPNTSSFLKRKIYLTIPICILLIVVFSSSALIVTLVSLSRVNNLICYTNNIKQVIQLEKPAPQPIYYSRPKRSLTAAKKSIPCFSFECCKTPLDSNAPWTNYRLPSNVYPVEYALELDLFHLNEENDQYNGVVDIVLEVQSPTKDIILHGDDLLYSDVTVSERSTPDNIQFNVDCAVPFPNTQTLIIHLNETLKVGSVYDLRISFFRGLNVHGTGIFENQFNKDRFGFEKSRMILTHFEPVHAREAFPCFDEPGFKAKFQLTVRHENDTKILSNWDEEESFPDANWIETEFQTTPAIPTALIAFSIFYVDDFDKKTVETFHPTTNRRININLWARKRYFENDNGIHVVAPLNMIQKIFTALLQIFKDIENPIVPTQIDVLAVPEYPSDVVSHWGFIIFTEASLLHNPETTSETEHQRIALLIAKEFAQQWYGNLISYRWWTELWLEEAISNFVKYHAVDGAYPEWNVLNQFSVGELLSAMYDDSMSTSHPVIKSVNSPTEIDELFDSIETTKTTAILRMADYYMEKTTGIKNSTLTNIASFIRGREYGYLVPDEFLSKYQIGQWDALKFFDRWLLQSNFPEIYVHFLPNAVNGTYTFQLQQSRFISTYMYDNDLYPPSATPFGYVWYVPVTCQFSNDFTKFELTRTFFLDKQLMNATLPTFYQYYYCNTDFAGYYIIDYTSANWDSLAQALDNDNAALLDLDRANLLHNAFLAAQRSEKSYIIVKGTTQFLLRDAYTGILSWQTLSYHVNRMLDVLEYESIFGVVQKYFRVVVRKYYQTYEANLWNGDGTFSEQILKNTIIQFACRVQLQQCIDKATLLWYEAFPALINGEANHTVVDHARDVVYQIHFQNTYNDTEWIIVASDYHNFIDIQERTRLLRALTQSRQPWHLYGLLYLDAEENQDTDVDLLQVLTLLTKNYVGRELTWLYYRKHWSDLQMEYERTNQRLGQLLIDITATFEDEFHEIELIDFLASTPGVDANVDARFWALERANMNFWWVVDNTEDFIDTFDLEP